MRILLLSAMVATMLASSAICQRTIPVENEQVRVVSVVDSANPARKGAMHDHQMNRVMIYLDEGTQRLTYQDGRVVNRPVKPGLVVWDPKLGGMHTSANVGGKDYRIVEVELRGEPKPFQAPALDPVKVHPSGYSVELDNQQVRVVRVRIPAGAKVPLHEHAINRLVVVLKPATIRVTPEGGTPADVVFKEGEVRFSNPGRHTEENVGAQPFEILMVELK